MAKNNQVVTNLRINADMNLRNIDNLKKELSKVVTDSGFDKKLVGTIEKCINNFERLEKDFTSLSKKTIFNEKDMKLYAKSVEDLGNVYKNVKDVMSGISNIDIAKSTKAYANYIEDLNKQVIALKQNFKEATGLNFDKEIGNLNQMKASVETLIDKKNELAKSGVSNEFNRLLKEQNNELDKHKIKLSELKKLRQEVSNTREAKAKEQYASYGELQSIASTKITKGQITTEFEQKEVDRLTKEYNGLEKQLQKVSKLKTEVARNRNIANIAKQLGVDANTIEDLQKAIDKARELIDVTARKNVRNDSDIQRQILAQYDALTKARDVAKEYLAQINAMSDALVKQSNLTSARTVSGLDSDITRTEIESSLEIDTDALQRQAEANVSVEIEGIETHLNQLVSLITQLVTIERKINEVDNQKEKTDIELKKAVKDSSKEDVASNKIMASAQKTVIKITGAIDEDTTAIRFNTSKGNNYNQKETANMVASAANILSLLKTELEQRKTELNVDDEAYNIIVDNLLDNKSAEERTGADVANSFSQLYKDLDYTYEKSNSEKIIEKVKKDIADSEREMIEAGTVFNRRTKEYEEAKKNFIIAQNNYEENKNNITEEIRDAAKENLIKAVKDLNEAQGKLVEAEAAEQKAAKTYQIMFDSSLEEANKNEKVKEGLGILSNEMKEILKKIPGMDKIGPEAAEALQEALKRHPSIAKSNASGIIFTNEEIIRKAAERKKDLGELNKIIDSNIDLTNKQAVEIKKASAAQNLFNDTVGELGVQIGTYFSLGYVLNHIFNLLRTGIDTIERMDDSIVQIGIVTNQTAQEVWGDIDKYIKQAKDLHMTTTDLLSATKLYYQQGLNTAEVNSMVEATARAAALGETTMADAANTLTSIMNSYQISATKMLDITDKISAVGSDSAADFGEMSQAIEKVASSAATAGLDIDHLMGYLGKMIEVTREAPTNIGTAMKTIVSRMAELKADPAKVLEDGTDLNRVETALKSVGIRLLDTTGNIRPLSDVINELGIAWEGLSRNHQAYLATIIAGNRQQSRFLALMNNYDRTLELVASAQDSAGRSAQQFRNYLTGTHAALDELKVQGEEFLTQLAHGNGAIRTLYKSLSGLLTLANQMGPVMTGLSLAFMGVGRSIFSTFKENTKATIASQIDGVFNLINNEIQSGKITALDFKEISKGTKAKGGFTNFIHSVIGGEKELEKFNTISKNYSDTIGRINKLEKQFSIEKDTGKQKIIESQIATEKENLAKTANAAITQTQNVKQKMLNATIAKTIILQAAASLGITLAIAGIGMLVNYLSDINKAERERLQALEDNTAQMQEEYSALETLINKYINLKEQITLTTEEKEQLTEITDELLTKYPELIAGIDAEGKAYAKTAKEMEKYLKGEEKKLINSKIETNNDKLRSKSTIVPGSGGVIGEKGFWGLKQYNSEDALGEQSKTAMEEAQTLYEGTKDYKDISVESDGKIGVVNSVVGDIQTALDSQAVGDWTQQEFETTYKDRERQFTERLNDFYNLNLQSFEDYQNNQTEIEEKIKADILKNPSNYDFSFSTTAVSNFQGLEAGAEKFAEEISSVVEGAVQRRLTSTKIQEVLLQSMADLASMAYTNLAGYSTKAIIDSNNYDVYGFDVENQLAAFQSNIINQKRKEFGTDVEAFKKWLLEYQQDENVKIANILMEANVDTEANEAINKAYENYVSLQKSGQSSEMVFEAYAKYLATIGGELQQMGLYSEKNQELLAEMLLAAKTQIEASEEDAEQILLNLGIDTNKDSEAKQQVLAQLNKMSSSQQEKFTGGISNIVNDKTLGTTEERQGIARQFSEAVSGMLEIKDSDFQSTFAQLDLNSQIAINEFVDNYKSYLAKAADEANMSLQEFINYLLGNPGINPAELETGLNEAISGIGKNKKANIQASFGGEMEWSEAIDAGLTSGQGVYSDGKFIMTTESATAAIEDNIKALEEQVKLLEENAKITSDSAYEQLIESSKELQRLEEQRAAAGGSNTAFLDTQIEQEKEKIKAANEQINQANTQLKNAKKLTKEIERQKGLHSDISKNLEFGEYANELNNTIGSLKNYASIYEQVKQGQLSELEVIELVAQDTQLLGAVYLDEAGHIALNAEALENLGESRIDEVYTLGETQIQKLEMLKSTINADETYSEAEQDILKNSAQNWVDMSDDEKQALFSVAQQLGYNVDSMEQWATLCATNIEAVTRVWNEYHKAQERGTGVELGITGRPGDVDAKKAEETEVKTGKSGADWIAEIDEEISKIKQLQSRLTKFREDGGSLYDSINDMGDNSGGGDSFEPIIEKLEKFYNYMRQLEELEAELNRIREKRNLIDATKNYYIDDLQKENELLKEQQSIYNDYIRDQGPYLQELRNQIQSMFGDWAYFNDEGVIQVKQTEFTANSEEEEERLSNFLELVDLYQNEYNTREENINKLYEIENTQLENIATMYEKILTRVQDITDALNRQKDLLDHDMTMSFSNIAKFNMMDDQMSTAAQGIKETYSYLNQFAEEMEDLNKEIGSGPFSELLMWDETLQNWRVNEEKLQDDSIVAKYEKMGYVWQDIDTYVRSVATESQSLREAWKETEDSANNFAQLLKQLVDDRISLIQDYYGAATEELNKIFNSFDSKMADADNQNNLFGVASESLEDKYLTLVTATVLLKQTIQQLKDNRGGILERIQKDYPEYIDLINGVAVVNKQRVEESQKLTEEQRSELLQLYGILEASEEQIGEMEDKLVEYFETMLEMEEAKRDAIVDLKQQVHDELIARDQEEIDNLRAKYDKMSQLDSEYYSELTQRVNDSRELRQNRQQASDIAQMQARLAILKADNSGTYNSELIELQKQLNTQLQTQADNEVNRELERIQREHQEREEDRQLTISAMENVLTFKDENSWYWQEAQRIWDEGPESVTGFLRSSREYMNISDEQRAVEFENLNNNMNTAFSTLQTEAGLSDRISDGVVIGKSDEEQIKLDMINTNIKYVNDALGENSNKIVWANSQNMLKLEEFNTNVAEGIIDITTKMQSLYTQGIEPGVKGVKDTIIEYLGLNSKIWNKIGDTNSAIGFVKSSMTTGFEDTVNAASLAATRIIEGIREAKEEYLKSDTRLYNWLNDRWAEKNAPKTPSNGNGNTTPPTVSGSGNSSSSTGGNGSGSTTAESRPELKIGATVSVKPGTKWYYDSYGTSPTGIARGGVIRYTNLKGSHPYNIEGLGWIRRQDIVGYSKGGYVDYTGIANVHGTQHEPEAFLNAKQTRLFEVLRDSLTRVSSSSNIDKNNEEITKEEYNISNVNIEVKEIADTDSIDKVVQKVKTQIYNDSIGRNNMAIRRR